MEFTPFSNQVHHLLKEKYSTNRITKGGEENETTRGKSRGKTKGREENKTTQRKSGHQGRGSHWPVVLVRFLNTAFCALPWTACFALDHISWAYWACFASFLDLVWHNLHLFS